MKSSDSIYVQRLCLDGFKHGIRIASQFFMELERDAFVQSLTGFTSLLTGNKSLKAKNVCPWCRSVINLAEWFVSLAV